MKIKIIIIIYIIIITMSATMVSVIKPSSRSSITFIKPFPNNMKDEICYDVFNQIAKSDIKTLLYISINHSYEGGFELPKTTSWIKYLDEHPSEYVRRIHIHQFTRQLRFITDKDDNIIGACCKDNINLFTDEELYLIESLVNNAIISLNIIDKLF